MDPVHDANFPQMVNQEKRLMCAFPEDPSPFDFVIACALRVPRELFGERFEEIQLNVMSFLLP